MSVPNYFTSASSPALKTSLRRRLQALPQELWLPPPFPLSLTLIASSDRPAKQARLLNMVAGVRQPTRTAA